jgi:hypothetical protein
VEGVNPIVWVRGREGSKNEVMVEFGAGVGVTAGDVAVEASRSSGMLARWMAFVEIWRVAGSGLKRRVWQAGSGR